MLAFGTDVPDMERVKQGGNGEWAHDGPNGLITGE